MTYINKEMKNMNVAFALTGSYCVFDQVIPQMKLLARNVNLLVPIISETVYDTDTRFYSSTDLIDDVYAITGRFPIHTIQGAEPIGPKNLCDMIVIAPCTGNTLAKMSHGIVDSCVLMAAKAILRNNGVVIIAISSNDALNNNAMNLGKLLAQKNIYFVPFGQDNYEQKPCSLVSDMELIYKTCEYAAKGEQLQPLIISH